MKKSTIIKAAAAIFSVFCVFTALAVTSFAEDIEVTETAAEENFDGGYGDILPSDKNLNELKTEYTFYGDSASMYFIVNSKGDLTAYGAVEIYSDPSCGEDSIVTQYSKPLGNESARSFSFSWKFKKLRSGIYYGKSYVYTDVDGQKTTDISTVRTFTVTVERIGRLTPDVISVTNGKGFVTVSWKELTYATKYRVYRKLYGDKSWTVLANVKKGTSAYKDTTVVNENKYIYTVKAFDGSYASLYNKKGVSVFYLSTAPEITAADAVSNGITLKWSKAQTIGKYTVTYKTDSGWKKLASTSATKFTDTSAAKNSVRTYRVFCVGEDGLKHYSGSVAAKRLKEPNVSVSSRDKTIVLKWSAVPNAEKYRVYRMTDGSWKKAGETAGTSYSVNAASGKDVIYAVRCISGDSKRFQSYYVPFYGRYTDYTFRGKKLNMAGGGTFTEPGKLTFDQQQAVFRYMTSYYSSIGSFRNTVGGIFYTALLRDTENAIWDSVNEVRSRAIEDLSLTRYKYVLSVKSLKNQSAKCTELTVSENVGQQFRDIPVLSQSFNCEHKFTLKKNSKGKWLVSMHESNCSPFYHFEYDTKTKKDKNLAVKLKCIDERQATVGVKRGKDPVCDHPYDRTAAKTYMMKWIDKRNPKYFAYDSYGGNCMNFASQILYAGGIHKTKGWNWYDDWVYAHSWIAVKSFAEYASGASKKELYCKCNDNYYRGNVGDIVLIGVESPRNHATVISDLILNDRGETVDYLLCCNTTNLKNFPAAAYHYTNQQLFRIYGWND